MKQHIFLLGMINLLQIFWNALYFVSLSAVLPGKSALLVKGALEIDRGRWENDLI